MYQSGATNLVVGGDDPGDERVDQVLLLHVQHGGNLSDAVAGIADRSLPIYKC